VYIALHVVLMQEIRKQGLLDMTITAHALDGELTLEIAFYSHQSLTDLLALHKGFDYHVLVSKYGFICMNTRRGQEGEDVRARECVGCP
jgi:hypothetical protein